LNQNKNLKKIKSENKKTRDLPQKKHTIYNMPQNKEGQKSG
jgi:hypothetical protein